MIFPEPYSNGHLDGGLLESRNRYILNAVIAGKADPIEWVTIPTGAKGHSATFYVSSDALRIDGVRVNVDALTAQAIADHLGASLNTSRTADLAWEACGAGALRPCTRPAGVDMSSTAAMEDHSRRVDAQVAGRSGLLRTVGKDSIIHPLMAANPATQAVNYGWHDPHAPYLSASGLHMWQTVGSRHNTKHVDYSQVLTLVRGDVLVDGAPHTVEEVLADPELAWLLSDDGALRVVRYTVAS